MGKNIKDLWNEAADSWNDFVEEGKDFYREYAMAPATLGLIPATDPENARALDLCCGEVYYSRKLKGLGYEAYGVNISDKLIRIAQEKDKEITYYCSDASNLNMFDDEYFSLVLCAMSLMDTPNYQEIILEARRILKSGGCFIFSIPHPCFSVEKGGWEKDPTGKKLFFKMDNYFLEEESPVEWNMGRLKYPFATKVYHRTISTYFNLLTENGFAVEELKEPYPVCKSDLPRLHDYSRIPSGLIMKSKKIQHL